jgi:hypothetical protein
MPPMGSPKSPEGSLLGLFSLLSRGRGRAPSTPPLGPLIFFSSFFSLIHQLYIVLPSWPPGTPLGLIRALFMVSGEPHGPQRHPDLLNFDSFFFLFLRHKQELPLLSQPFPGPLSFRDLSWGPFRAPHGLPTGLPGPCCNCDPCHCLTLALPS